MSELLAGAASVDITPSLGCHLCGYFTDRVADNIHDPLHAKAIALRSGETTLGLVVCDVIDVPVEVVAAAKGRIQELTGIPPSHILISATHTHTGPSIVGALGTPKDEKYGQETAPRIASLQGIAPARCTTGAGA